MRVTEAHDLDLIAALQDGLPLVPRPYACLGQRIGLSEAEVIARLRGLIDRGVIRRFGVIVRHRALGYRANAMVVWDLPEAEVGAAGARLAALPYVTLCYRRPRRLPDWPYNLFCMIHGRDRLTVEGQIGRLNDTVGTQALPQAVLFSRRCFKQRGARFSGEAKEAAA